MVISAKARQRPGPVKRRVRISRRSQGKAHAANPRVASRHMVHIMRAATANTKAAVAITSMVGAITGVVKAVCQGLVATSISAATTEV